MLCGCPVVFLGELTKFANFLPHTDYTDFHGFFLIWRRWSVNRRPRRTPWLFDSPAPHASASSGVRGYYEIGVLDGRPRDARIGGHKGRPDLRARARLVESADCGRLFFFCACPGTPRLWGSAGPVTQKSAGYARLALFGLLPVRLRQSFGAVVSMESADTGRPLG